jgi:hypothetical protein
MISRALVGQRLMRRKFWTWTTIYSLAAAALMPMWAAAAEPTVTAVEVYGTSFRAILSDGSVKQGPDLAGAVLVIAVNGARLRVRIASIVPDPLDKVGTVLLHDFRLEDSGEPLCAPGPDGKRLGFPLAGRSLPDGRFVAAQPEVSS